MIWVLVIGQEKRKPLSWNHQEAKKKETQEEETNEWIEYGAENGSNGKKELKKGSSLLESSVSWEFH